MWGIIALIAIYLIINSGRIYIQRRDFLASFECLLKYYIYIHIYKYLTPVKKKKISDIFWKKFIIVKKMITFLW